MLPEFIEAIRRSCLPAQSVSERLGVVGPMTEPSGLVPEADAPDVEERGVRVAKGVPSHARPVEIPHSPHECVECSSIVAANREGKLGEKALRAWAERHCSESLASLRRVHTPIPILRTTYAQDGPVDVVFPDGDDLSPPESGKKDELGHLAPDAGESVDDRLDLGECEVVVASGGRRDTWTVKWDRHGSDHPAPDGVLEGGGEAGVDALHGGRRLAGGEQVGGELGQVLRADLPDEHGTEPRLDVADPAPVAGERVRTGTRFTGLGGQPKVKCATDGFVWPLDGSGKCPFCGDPFWPDRDVRVPPADLPADEPLAAALLPFGALVATSLDEGGH